MSYPWPLEDVASHLDTAQVPDPSETERKLADSGIHPELVAFLRTLYARADRSTLFGGTLRLHPLEGDAEHGLAALAAWNQPELWK